MSHGADTEERSEGVLVPAPAGPVRIAVACGSPEQRQSTAAALRANGLDARAAERHEPAHLAKDAPDAILLLWGGKPEEVCRRLKGHPAAAAIPVLVLSPPGALESKMALIKAGADELIETGKGEPRLGELLLRFVAQHRSRKRWMRADALLVSLARRSERRGCSQHGERTAFVAERLAAAMGLAAGERASLRRAAILHDVGELSLPDYALLRPGPLTMLDWEAERTHPDLGADFIAVLLGDEAAAAAVRAHHERLNGSGYPRGLSGSDVPLLAQVLAVADVFAALTASRPHRGPLTTSAALQSLQRSAALGELNAEMVKALEGFAHELKPADLRGEPAVRSLGKLKAALLMVRAEAQEELAGALVDAGCVVRSIQDLDEARRLAQGEESGIAVVDLACGPVALELIAAARNRDPDAEILAVLASHGEVQAPLAAGASGIIDPASGMPAVAQGVLRAAARCRARRGRQEAFEELTARTEVLDRLLAERGARIATLESALKLEQEARAAVERELEQSGEQLMRAERLAQLGRISASIVHEINNPLAFARSSLFALREELGDKLSGDDACALDDALHGIERIVAIVRDVRSYTRGETGVLVQVDVNRAVRAAEAMLRSIAAHRVQLELALGDAPPARGQENPLVQVVINLVVNAIDAAPMGSRVLVRTRPAPDGAVIEVEDSGPGIPPELREKIFEPFFTTKSPEAGTGMGLAISRSIIDRMGGAVTFQSRAGQTVFSVWLPSALDPDEGPAE